MKNCNPRNERIKRDYFQYLREADQKSEATVRGIEKALARFEEHTGFTDLGKFKAAQAMAFKAGMADGGKDRRLGGPHGAGVKFHSHLATLTSTVTRVPSHRVTSARR